LDNVLEAKNQPIKVSDSANRTEINIVQASSDIVEPFKPESQPTLSTASQHSGTAMPKSSAPTPTQAIGNPAQSINQPAPAPNQPNHSLPNWQIVRLASIEMHPLLSTVYTRLGLAFPPVPPDGYLTGFGIRMLSRLVPIQCVQRNDKVLCFAGVCLWFAALKTLGLDKSIEILLYQDVDDAKIPEIVEAEHDILMVWHRQSDRERKALDAKYVDSANQAGLTENFDGKEQGKWTKILKIFLKTLQNRISAVRRNP